MKSIKRHLEIMTTLNENTVTIPMVRQMAQRALDDMNAMKLNKNSLYGQIHGLDLERRYYAIDPARSDDMIDAIKYAFKSPTPYVQQFGRALRPRRKWWQLWKRKAPLILDFETKADTGAFDVNWMKREGLVK